jgi:N-acetylmuramoyl-L-alanine amidase
MNRNAIVLDPAHGGQDNGAFLNGHTEKDLTLDLASSLKDLLTARGFSVVATRDADLPAVAPLLTTDQRAGTANHLRPVACIILHATPYGSGVHLITSSLPPSDVPYEPSATVPWESAQTAYLPLSQSLANDLGLALLRAKISVQLIHAAIRPLDNLTCPAIVIEIAPLLVSGQKPTPATDSGYQQRLVVTLAAAILSWRDTNAPRPAPKPAQPANGSTP